MKNRYIQDVEEEIAALQAEVDRLQASIVSIETRKNGLVNLISRWSTSSPVPVTRSSPKLEMRESLIEGALKASAVPMTSAELVAATANGDNALTQKEISTTLSRSTKFEKVAGNQWQSVGE